MANDLICWEALDPDGPAVEQARALYEATQHPDERIPWDWIRSAVGRRKSWRPGRWGTHLILAAPTGTKRKPGAVVGFANFLHLPGYGGYLPYIGVDPAARRGGVGTRLMKVGLHLLRADSACSGGELPFVIWESRPPAPGDGAARRAWQARLGLWRTAGASYVSGVTMHAVNYMKKKAPPLRLALFLLPDATPAASFDSDALREVISGLLRDMYGRKDGDEYFTRTLPAGHRPRLRPVEEALDLVGE